MTELMETISLSGMLLAQIGDSGGAPGGGAAVPAAPGGGGGGGNPGSITGLLIPMMVAFMVLMIFTSFRTQKKEKRRREELLRSLRKHDKVQTHAGIIGTVVELKEDQVVLKVDENTNTRIRFARSAIAQVLASRGGGGGTDGGGTETADVIDEDEVAEADLARA